MVRGILFARREFADRFGAIPRMAGIVVIEIDGECPILIIPPAVYKCKEVEIVLEQIGRRLGLS